MTLPLSTFEQLALQMAFSVSEAAIVSRIEEKTLREAMASGELRHFRPSQRAELRISREALLDFIRRREESTLQGTPSIKMTVAKTASTVATRGTRKASLTASEREFKRKSREI